MGDGINNIPGIKIKPPENGVYQGVFAQQSDNELVETTLANIEDFEKMSGSDVDISLKFIHFQYGLDFPKEEATAIAEKGGALFIKLEPRNPEEKGTNPFALEDIIAGKHDDLLRNFARGAKGFGKPVFVSFGHEMNGNWYPWSGNPKLYVKAYHYVVDFMRKEGANNLTWVWNPNVDFPAEEYYPGAEYVDWVAVDGYDFGKTGSAESILGRSINYLKTLNKPIMIGEFACADDNAQCLTDFVDYVVENKEIKAYIYFNQDKEEKWKIRTAEEEKAYNEAIKKHDALFRRQIETTGSATTVPEPSPSPAPKQKEIPLKDPKNKTEARAYAIQYCSQAAPEECDSLLAQLENKGYSVTIDKNTSGAVDTQIGEEGVASSELDPLRAKDALPFEQVEATLTAFFIGQPSDKVYDLEWALKRSDKEKLKYSSDLGRILRLDQLFKHKLYGYIANQSVWSNVITLLSLYVQMATEKADNEALASAFKFIQLAEQRIKSQQINEKVYLPEVSYLPSDYHLALLMIVKGETLASLEKDPDKAQKYLVKGIKAMLKLENKEFYSSPPDYFTVGKAILTLGTTYAQMKKYDAAQACFDAVTNNGIFYVNKGLKINISVSRAKISEALVLQQKNMRITDAMAAEAEKGYDKFLVPFARLKSAELLLARANKAKKADRVKLAKEAMVIFDSFTPEGIEPVLYAQAQIEAVEAFITIASEEKPEDLDKQIEAAEEKLANAKKIIVDEKEQESYFYHLATVTDARLIVMRANYFNDHPEKITASNDPDKMLITAYEMLQGIPKDYTYLHSVAIVERNAIVAQKTKLFSDPKITAEWKDLDEIIAAKSSDYYLHAKACITKAELLIAAADMPSQSKDNRKKYVAEATDLLGRAKKELSLNQSKDDFLYAKAGLLEIGLFSRNPGKSTDLIDKRLAELAAYQKEFKEGTYFWALSEFYRGLLFLAKADATKDKNLGSAKDQLLLVEKVSKGYPDLLARAELINLSLLLRDPDELEELTIVMDLLPKAGELAGMLVKDQYYCAFANQVEAELHIALADKIEKQNDPNRKSEVEAELVTAAALLQPEHYPKEYTYLHNKTIILYCALVARQKPLRDKLIAQGKYEALQKELKDAIVALETAGEKKGYLIAQAYATQAEMLIQTAEIPHQEMEKVIGYLTLANEKIKKAAELSEPYTFLYAKAIILQATIYTRLPVKTTKNDLERSICLVQEVLFTQGGSIGEYLNTYGTFVLGQLHLSLANKKYDMANNLIRAGQYFSLISKDKDPFLYASARVHLIELEVRKANYIDAYPDGKTLKFRANSIAVEAIRKECTNLKEEIATLIAPKDPQSAEQLVLQVDLFDLTLWLTLKTKALIDDTIFTDYLERIAGLSEPSKSILTFEVKIKQLALCLEKWSKEKEEEEKEKIFGQAQALISELESKQEHIRQLGRGCGWDVGYLMAEFYAQAAVHYAIKQSIEEKQIEKYSADERQAEEHWKTYYKYQSNAAQYAKRAYVICDQSVEKYFHDWLPMLIEQNSGIKKIDAMKVKLPYEEREKENGIIVSPTPTQASYAATCAGNPIDCLNGKIDETIPPTKSLAASLPFLDRFSTFLILNQSWAYYKKQWISKDGMPLVDNIPGHEKAKKGEITVSEAASYVLLRAAIMGDQDTFNQVWKWVKTNLQRENIEKVYDGKEWITFDPGRRNHLFVWLYTANADGKGKGGVISGPDTDSASDADQDIAAALLIASAKFGDDNLKSEAVDILKDIFEQETAVIDGKRVLLAGDRSDGTIDPMSKEENAKQTYSVNPSYFRFSYYESLFAQADPAHPWKQLVTPSYQIIGMASSATFHDEKGNAVKRKQPIIPDFMAITSDFQPTDYGWAPGDHAERADYYSGGDAFRTFFWLAMQDRNYTRDYLADETLKNKQRLDFYREQLKEHKTIYNAYNIDGTIHWQEETPQTLAGYLCLFVAAGDTDTAKIIYDRLMSNANYNSNGYWGKEDKNYYGQNWAWFAIAFMAGKFDF